MGAAIKGAREKLIESGRALILRDGFRKMRIQDLTSECGMAAGTLYSYFKNKSELFESILQDDWETTVAEMDSQLQKEYDVKARLCIIYNCFLKFHHRYFQNIIELKTETDENEKIANIFTESFHDLSLRVSESLKIALSRGEIIFSGESSLEECSIMVVENMISVARNQNLDFDRYARILLRLISVKPEKEDGFSGEELSDAALAYLIRVTPGRKAFYRIYDDKAETLYLSPNLFDFIGVDATKLNKVIYNNAMDLVYPEDRPGLLRAVYSCIETGKAFHYCWRNVYDKRKPDWVQADGSLVGKRNGAPVLAIIYNSIDSENDMYQTLIDGTETKIYVCDSKTHEILYENKAAAESGSQEWGQESKRCYELIRGNHQPCEDCFMYGQGGGEDMFHQIRYNPYTNAWEQLSGKNVNWCGHDASIHYIRDITDLKMAQQQYEQEKKRYSIAVEGANLSVWEYHIPERRIIGSGSSFGKFKLPTMIENVPDSILPLLEEQNRANFREMYRKIDAGESHVFGDYWMKGTADRPASCEHVEYTVEKDSDGKPTIAYGVSIDITAQERERARFKETMQEMLTANPQSLCHFTLNLTHNMCHEGQGKSSEVIKRIQSGTVEGLFENIVKLIPSPKQKKEFKNRFSRENLISCYQNGQTYVSMEYERLTTKGDLISVMTAIRMIKNPFNGDITGAVYSMDITEKKRMSDVLRLLTSQEHQMISVLNLKSHSVEALYLGRKIPEAYRYFFKKPGDVYDVEKLKQHNFETWIYPEDRPIYADGTNLDKLAERLDQNGKFEFTVRVNQSGEKLGIRFRKFEHYWLNDAHEQVLTLTSDVTESVRRQQEELQKEKELRKAALAANEAKTVFLSRMSHDIRTPINGITGMVHIARGQDNPPKTEDCLRKIDVSSKFLLGLVNEVLDMSKAESGKMELHLKPYTQEELSDYLISVIKPLSDEKGIIFKLEDDLEKGIVAVTDTLRINQVMFNLLSNAIKYTPAGGTVTCRLWSRVLTPGKLSFKFTVSDTGIGISQEFKERLFEPFVQENRSDNDTNRGTGLGLAIVKKIVDVMGGTITVDSMIGKGTTFTVDLVFDAMSEDQIQTDSSKEPVIDLDAALSGKKVLLCEDNSLNQEIAKALLEEKKMVVIMADNGQEGCDLFRKSADGYFDAVLMDLRMPVMDGHKATKEIRSLDRKDARIVPIIAMSADAFEEDIKKCLREGMNGHISKPIEPFVMYQTIANCLPDNKKHE